MRGGGKDMAGKDTERYLWREKRYGALDRYGGKKDTLGWMDGWMMISTDHKYAACGGRSIVL